MKKRQKFNYLHGGVGADTKDGNLIPALQSWKKQVKEFGIIKEIKQRKFFTKKSEKRRNVIKNAIFLRKKSQI